jgi:hypothetical protein
MKDLTNMTPQATIFTDASDTGWGIKSEWVTTSGLWTPEEREESINVRELKTILFALQIHRRNATNTHIRLFTDSITALKFVKKHGGTSSLQLQELAIEIQQLITANNITIDFQHIPGKNNTIADRLSRRARPVYEWKLPKWWFRKIQRRWGRRILDAFAAHHNRQLPRYWSRLPDPQAEAIDAFAQQWPKKGLFLHPPWKLIPRVLRTLQIQKVREAIMVTPFWTTQFWYPSVMKMATEKPLLLQINKSIILAAWKLSPEHKKQRAYQKKRSNS